MRTYHVFVEQAEDWLAAHALEDDSVHSQGKTLDEITANIREVAALVCGDHDIHIELVIPSHVKVASPIRANRIHSPSASPGAPASGRC